MHKILGTDDSVNSCDCCGRSNLKFTFAVDVNGEVLHYGSVCATRHTGKSASEVRKEAQDATEARRLAAVKEVREHPTYAAYRKRHDEAMSLGLIGLKCKEFCKVEREAQEEFQRSVAERTGFSVIRISM